MTLKYELPYSKLTYNLMVKWIFLGLFNDIQVWNNKMNKINIFDTDFRFNQIVISQDLWGMCFGKSRVLNDYEKKSPKGRLEMCRKKYHLFIQRWHTIFLLTTNIGFSWGLKCLNMFLFFSAQKKKGSLSQTLITKPY